MRSSHGYQPTRRGGDARRGSRPIDLPAGGSCGAPLFNRLYVNRRLAQDCRGGRSLRIQNSGNFETGLSRIAAIALLCLFLAATVIAGAGDFASASSGKEQAQSIRIELNYLPVNSNGRAVGSDDLTVDSTNVAPDHLQRISAEQAMRVNVGRPDTSLPIPPASPFIIGNEDSLNRMRAVECLAAAIYYEAANEPLEGQKAVAQVVLNRLRFPQYPRSVCGVVFQGSNLATGCQFSFTCDGSMRRIPSAAGWRRAEAVAVAALSGMVNSKVGLSTHYHADYVVPYWAPKLVKLKTIGRHIFYGWPGYWNRPAAFNQAYAGKEGGLLATARDGTTDDLLQMTEGQRSAALTNARVTSIDERPIIFDNSAKPMDANTTATSEAPRSRWVLVAPSKEEQTSSGARPL